jgi:hypothetical protein
MFERRSFVTIAVVVLVGFLGVCPSSVVRGQLSRLKQSASGQQESIEGVLKILYEDQDSEGRLRYFLETSESRPRRLSLRFPADAPLPQSGTRIRVTGLRTAATESDHSLGRVDEVLVLNRGTASVETLSAAAPDTFGEQRTAVILVNFQDRPTERLYPPNDARDVMSTASDFFLENSYRRTWLTSDVFGWYTIPVSSAVCEPAKIAASALQSVASAGVDLSAYTRFVYAFPRNACRWWGLGTVGGAPSEAWINGDFQLKVVAHELGHSLGLYHSRALECGATAIGADCRVIEYGDTLDIMGTPSPGHFNAFQKERLGWLDPSDAPLITPVETDGVYFLRPYESGDSGLKALRILKSVDPTTGKQTWYYVEFRQAMGFDRFLSDNSNVRSGVILHTGSESSGDSSFLLDMTPETAPWSDPALVASESFYDPEAEVTITVVSATREGATVSVKFGRLDCVRANPTVELSPSEGQWVKSGAPLTYLVSVTNNDNPACSASSFDLTATVPKDWLVAPIDPVLNLSPGRTIITMLHVATSSTAAEGVYTIIVAAANRASVTHCARASAELAIANAFKATVSTDQSSYARPQAIGLTAHVSALGRAVSGASVVFTVKKPNGEVITGVTTTRADGSAVIQCRLNEHDPVGVYQVRADASANGITTSAATSFAVQ